MTCSCVTVTGTWTPTHPNTWLIHAPAATINLLHLNAPEGVCTWNQYGIIKSKSAKCMDDRTAHLLLLSAQFWYKLGWEKMKVWRIYLKASFSGFAIITIQMDQKKDWRIRLTIEWPSFVVSTFNTGQLSMTSAPWPLASCTCTALPSAASTRPPSFWYNALMSSLGVNCGNLSRNWAGVRYSNLINKNQNE